MSEAHHQEMRAEEPPRAAVLVVSLPWGELRAGLASSPGGHFFLTEAGGHGCGISLCELGQLNRWEPISPNIKNLNQEQKMCNDV